MDDAFEFIIFTSFYGFSCSPRIVYTIKIYVTEDLGCKYWKIYLLIKQINVYQLAKHHFYFTKCGLSGLSGSVDLWISGLSKHKETPQYY